MKLTEAEKLFSKFFIDRNDIISKVKEELSNIDKTQIKKYFENIKNIIDTQDIKDYTQFLKDLKKKEDIKNNPDNNFDKIFKDFIDKNKTKSESETKDDDIEIDEFDASQANLILQNKKELNNILNLLKLEIENDKDFLRVYEKLSDFTLDKLKEKGFHIFENKFRVYPKPYYIIYVKTI